MQAILFRLIYCRYDGLLLSRFGVDCPRRGPSDGEIYDATLEEMNHADVLPRGGTEGHPIVLYDGVCGLCNRMVQFVLKRDRRGVFRFAPLQGAFANRVLRAHGENPADLDTVYAVVNCDPAQKVESGQGVPEQRLLARSDAVLFVARELGGVWGAAGWVLRLVPRAVRDWGYRVVAGNRYRIFGRYDACPLPSEATRERFLDV